MIIASDLPSFKETLTGFSDEMFFENGNAKSLAKTIENCFQVVYKNENANSVIEKLCDEYSWEKIGKRYLNFVCSSFDFS
jgi:glycogen synthase